MLKFLGIGSAFNVDLGNNSAYILENGELTLIDCGSNVFDKIIKKQLLKGVTTINVVITHLHPDHVGSLGDLLYYCKYIINNPCTVYVPARMGLENLLDLMGVYSVNYNIQHLNEQEENQIGALTFVPVEVKHYPNMVCFGYEISDGKNRLYYSGDTYEFPEELVDKLSEGYFDRIYQDVSTINFEGNPHLYFGDLKTIVPKNLRDKIFCMHLDNKFDRYSALHAGFKVVAIEK